MAEQFNLADYRKLDGRTLKMIAIISMFIDHFGAALTPNIMLFRIVGRLAFPIYCFLLVEGAKYTHDFKQYMVRMGIFALISEVFFDLALYHKIIYVSHQNVFLTLLLGLGMIWFLEHPMQDMDIPDVINKMIIVAVAGIAAELLGADYGFSGIVIIFAFYILQNQSWLKYLIVALICIGMGGTECFAVLALIPIALYNGQRGRQTKIMQYGFYAFYPAHLLLLAIIYQMTIWIAK